MTIHFDTTDFLEKLMSEAEDEANNALNAVNMDKLKAMSSAIIDFLDKEKIHPYESMIAMMLISTGVGVSRLKHPIETMNLMLCTMVDEIRERLQHLSSEHLEVLMKAKKNATIN